PTLYPSYRMCPSSTPRRALRSADPLRSEVVIGRRRQLRLRHRWRRDRWRLLQDVLEGRGVPPTEGVPLQFIEAMRRVNRHLHRLLELVECEMSVHLEEHDLAGSRDDRHGAVRVPEVVLLLVQVDADDAVDLPRGAGRDEVPHRYAGLGQ